MDLVKAYFDGEADTYQAASGRGFWSLMRLRESRALEAMLGNIRNDEVLEFGCGAGYYTRMLLAHGAAHVTAVDLSEPMLSHLPEGRVTSIQGDAANLAFEKAFDLVFSAGMLEFVTSPIAVFLSAARHTKPGGRFVMLCPRRGIPGHIYASFHRRHGLAINLFNEQALHKLAEQSGWRLEETRNAGLFALCASFRRISA